MRSLHEINKDGYWITEGTMYKIADCLMKHNSTYKIDYENKYGVLNITKEATVPLKDKSKKGTSNIEESPLYNELREYRLNKSREEKVKPYFLYNNRELETIIKVKPKTIEELKSIKGFGDVKCGKYGTDIINIISKYTSNL